MPRPFLLPLFTRVRGRVILGRWHTGSCINGPPAPWGARISASSPNAVGLHVVAAHGYADSRIVPPRSGSPSPCWTGEARWWRRSRSRATMRAMLRKSEKTDGSRRAGPADQPAGNPRSSCRNDGRKSVLDGLGQCARFLIMNRDEFGKVAKTIPRHPLPPKRPGTVSRRYRYYAPRSRSGSWAGKAPEVNRQATD